MKFALYFLACFIAGATICKAVMWSHGQMKAARIRRRVLNHLHFPSVTLKPVTLANPYKGRDESIIVCNKPQGARYVQTESATETWETDSKQYLRTTHFETGTEIWFELRQNSIHSEGCKLSQRSV